MLSISGGVETDIRAKNSASTYDRATRLIRPPGGCFSIEKFPNRSQCDCPGKVDEGFRIVLFKQGQHTLPRSKRFLDQASEDRASKPPTDNNPTSTFSTVINISDYNTDFSYQSVLSQMATQILASIHAPATESPQGVVVMKKPYWKKRKPKAHTQGLTSTVSSREQSNNDMPPPATLHIPQVECAEEAAAENVQLLGQNASGVETTPKAPSRRAERRKRKEANRKAREALAIANEASQEGGNQVDTLPAPPGDSAEEASAGVAQLPEQKATGAETIPCVLSKQAIKWRRKRAEIEARKTALMAIEVANDTPSFLAKIDDLPTAFQEGRNQAETLHVSPVNKAEDESAGITQLPKQKVQEVETTPNVASNSKSAKRYRKKRANKVAREAAARANELGQLATATVVIAVQPQDNVDKIPAAPLLTVRGPLLPGPGPKPTGPAKRRIQPGSQKEPERGFNIPVLINERLPQYHPRYRPFRDATRTYLVGHDEGVEMGGAPI